MKPGHYYNHLVLELLRFEEVYVVCGFLHSFFCNCLSKLPIPIPLLKKKKKKSHLRRKRVKESSIIHLALLMVAFKQTGLCFKCKMIHGHQVLQQNLKFFLLFFIVFYVKKTNILKSFHFRNILLKSFGSSVAVLLGFFKAKFKFLNQ